MSDIACRPTLCHFCMNCVKWSHTGETIGLSLLSPPYYVKESNFMMWSCHNDFISRFQLNFRGLANSILSSTPPVYPHDPQVSQPQEWRLLHSILHTITTITHSLRIYYVFIIYNIFLFCDLAHEGEKGACVQSLSLQCTLHFSCLSGCQYECNRCQEVMKCVSCLCCCWIGLV